MTAEPILDLPQGLSIEVQNRRATLPPLQLVAGQRLLLTPEVGLAETQLAVALARAFGSLGGAAEGTVQLLGQPVSSLNYIELLRLRARLGYVQGRGGLLANRTVRDNLLLPLSIHAQLLAVEEHARVDAQLDAFDIRALADLRPHQLDREQQFAVCAARAAILRPQWYVLETTGDFSGTLETTPAWRALLQIWQEGASAAVLCLSRANPLFEQWMIGQGATVQRWQTTSTQRPQQANS